MAISDVDMAPIGQWGHVYRLRARQDSCAAFDQRRATIQHCAVCTSTPVPSSTVSRQRFAFVSGEQLQVGVAPRALFTQRTPNWRLPGHGALAPEHAVPGVLVRADGTVFCDPATGWSCVLDAPRAPFAPGSTVTVTVDRVQELVSIQVNESSRAHPVARFDGLPPNTELCFIAAVDARLPVVVDIVPLDTRISSKNIAALNRHLNYFELRARKEFAALEEIARVILDTPVGCQCNTL